MGVQSDDIVDETEGSYREIDGNVVDGRKTTIVFVTGIGTGATDVDGGIKGDGRVTGTTEETSSSGNNGKGTFPMLPPRTT